MTDKEAVIDAIGRLPERASLAEITEELQIMGAVRRGRNEISEGKSKTHADVERVFESWATEWTSR